MRALLIAVLLLASCATVKPEPPKAPDYATAFANALCDRNATYIAANAVGRIAGTESDIADYFSTLPTCTAVRYVVHDGPGYLFILHEADVDVPYLFTFNADGKCKDVR